MFSIITLIVVRFKPRAKARFNLKTKDKYEKTNKHIQKWRYNEFLCTYHPLPTVINLWPILFYPSVLTQPQIILKQMPNVVSLVCKCFCM